MIVSRKSGERDVILCRIRTGERATRFLASAVGDSELEWRAVIGKSFQTSLKPLRHTEEGVFEVELDASGRTGSWRRSIRQHRSGKLIDCRDQEEFDIDIMKWLDLNGADPEEDGESGDLDMDDMSEGEEDDLESSTVRLYSAGGYVYSAVKKVISNYDRLVSEGRDLCYGKVVSLGERGDDVLDYVEISIDSHFLSRVAAARTMVLAGRQSQMSIPLTIRRTTPAEEAEPKVTGPEEDDDNETTQNEEEQDMTKANSMVSGMEKMMGGAIGADTTGKFKASLMGIAILNGEGNFCVYDGEQLIEVMDFIIPGMDGVFRIPTLNVEKGDLILHMGEPQYVRTVNEDKSIETLNPISSKIERLMPTKNMLGFKFYVKLVSMTDMMGLKANVDSENPFAAMMPMLMMQSMMGGSDKEGDSPMGGMMQMMLMSQMFGGAGGANPFAAMLGGGGQKEEVDAPKKAAGKKAQQAAAAAAADDAEEK